MARKNRPPAAATAPRATVMVFADASLCRHTGASGWGAWVKRDGGRSAVFGGAFTDPMRTSHDAECAAMANAVHVAAGRGLIRTGDVVMLQSDNMAILHRARFRLAAADNPARGGLAVALPRNCFFSQRQKAAIDVLRKVQLAANLRFVVRHVKGHSDDATGRSWVNGECDRIAKQHMRERRADFRAAALDAAPATRPSEEVTADA